MSNAALLLAGAALSLFSMSPGQAQQFPDGLEVATAAHAAPIADVAIGVLADHIIELTTAEVSDGIDPVVSDDDLNANRGGQAIVVGNQTLTSITSGNTLTGDYVAGSVTLADSAFSNFTGVGNIAINTGAQVSLQSGVNVIINIGQ